MTQTPVAEVPDGKTLLPFDPAHKDIDVCVIRATPAGSMYDLHDALDRWLTTAKAAPVSPGLVSSLRVPQPEVTGEPNKDADLARQYDRATADMPTVHPVCRAHGHAFIDPGLWVCRGLRIAVRVVVEATPDGRNLLRKDVEFVGPFQDFGEVRQALVEMEKDSPEAVQRYFREIKRPKPVQPAPTITAAEQLTYEMGIDPTQQSPGEPSARRTSKPRGGAADLGV